MQNGYQDITIAENTIEIPAYYQQVDSMPEDPKDSIPLMVQTDSAMCFAIVHPIGPDERMPYDQLAVINGIRDALADNQGIIEVEADASSNRPYIYSIVKDLKNEDGMPMGVQYILTMDIGTSDGAFLVQGFFDEIGTTGMRDTLIGSMLKSEGKIGQHLEGWMRDPYDPEWSFGMPMNLSEQRCYDEMFPTHPLSMARALIDCLVG